MQKFYNKNLSLKAFTKRVKIFALFFIIPLLSVTAFANTYNVTDVTDGHATNQLRGAIEAADAAGGSHTINVAAGTYVLTLGQITFGNTAQNITIIGAGPASTIISMTAGATRDRIFFINPSGTTNSPVISVSGIKFQNGYLTSDPYGGAAICAGGGSAESLTVTNCIFDNNIVPANSYGGGAICMQVRGNLSVDNCTFTNNVSNDADGGAILFIIFGSTLGTGYGTLNVTNSTFTGNSVVFPGAPASNGGAIAFTGQAGSTPFNATITKNTFLNNSADGYGGGISANNSPNVSIPQIHYNRFVGNTSATNTITSGMLFVHSAGSVNAENNWWGCNTGPSAAGTCDRASGIGAPGVGIFDADPWLQLKTTASPNPICNTPAGLGNTSTVTTSFLSNSAGEAIAVADLSTLIGRPVTWTSTLGTLSAQQATIQASGTATTTFTSNGTGGSATVNAQVDNVPVADPTARATITVNTLPTVTNPVNTTVCRDGTVIFTSTITGTPIPTIQWRIGTTALVDGLQASGSTISGANTATLTITNAQSGDALTNYNVEASNHCGTATSTDAALTVNIPSVAPSGITGTTIYCNPGSTTLTAVGGTLGTGANYQWGTGSVVGTSALVGETNSTLNVSPTSTTTYWVRIENTAAPCPPNTDGITQVVTVNQPSVAPTSITGTTTICNGSSTTLTAAGGTLGTGANYQWGTGNTVGTSALVGETNSTLNVSPTSTTTYWVRIENTTAPCTANTGGVTQVVTVNQPSVAPTSISGTTTVCNGSSTILTAMGGTLGTGANYQWGTGNTVGASALVGETNSTLNVSPTSTTTYWVRIENTTAPCIANTGGSTHVVTVNQPSVAPTGATGSTTICIGGSTTLTVAGGTKGTGATTEWFTGSCEGTPAGTGDAITVSPTTNTTYYVRYNGTCNTTDCATVTVNITSNNTINLTSGMGTDAQTECINTAITNITYATTGATGANVTGLPAGVNGSWVDDEVTISGTPSASGIFNYIVTLTGGCGSVTANGSITVDPVPIVNAPGVIQPSCAEPDGKIEVNATGVGILEYSINGGSDWFISNIFNPGPGSYTIAVRSQTYGECVSNYSGNPVVLTAATGCTVAPTFTLCPTSKSFNADAGVCTATLSRTTLLSYVTAIGTPSPTLTVKVGATTVTTSYAFPKGNTTVSITASNGTLPNATCSFTITVTDNQPPVINTVTNPIVLLWPPNHKYQRVNVSQFVTSVTDNCGSIAVGNVVITHVTSDEAENAPGMADGNTTNDMKIAANCKSVDLRRERVEGGDGRVYTIHFKVTDENGNTATATAKVLAPPNQSSATAVDNGAIYTEQGPCYVATRPSSSQLITKNTEEKEFMMAQNYPNPFSTSTVIRYGLLKDAQVNLAVYNSLGQKVAQLEEGRMSAGYHQATFDASKLAAGIYLYRLQALDADGKPFVLNKKMIVAK